MRPKRTFYAAALCTNLFLLIMNIYYDNATWWLSLAGASIFLFLLIATWSD